MSFQNPVKLWNLLVPEYDRGPGYDTWRINAIFNGASNRPFHHFAAGNPLHGTDAEKLVKKG